MQILSPARCSVTPHWFSISHAPVCSPRPHSLAVWGIGTHILMLLLTYASPWLTRTDARCWCAGNAHGYCCPLARPALSSLWNSHLVACYPVVRITWVGGGTSGWHDVQTYIVCPCRHARWNREVAQSCTGCTIVPGLAGI